MGGWKDKNNMVYICDRILFGYKDDRDLWL